MSAAAIAHLCAVDPVLGRLIGAVGPCTLAIDAGCAPFQSLAQAITHQQLNGSAARSIFNRFITACGNGSVPTPHSVLAAPEATLRAAGLSFAKVAALRDLAAQTIAGVVPDHATLVELPDAQIIERLTQVRGIGRWTVEMMLMFRLGRPDVLPVADFGVRSGFQVTYGLSKLPEPKALAAFGERWAPHRTVASWYLWRAVELARAGKLPVPTAVTRLPRLRKRKAVRPGIAAVGKKTSAARRSVACAAPPKRKRTVGAGSARRAISKVRSKRARR